MVNVRTLGSMGRRGKANWDVGNEFPLPFLSHHQRGGGEWWGRGEAVIYSGEKPMSKPSKVDGWIFFGRCSRNPWELISGFYCLRSVNPNVELKNLLFKFELVFFCFYLSEGGLKLGCNSSR